MLCLLQLLHANDAGNLQEKKNGHKPIAPPKNNLIMEFTLTV